MEDGETVTRTEPELDWVDVAIMTAWLGIHDDTCQHCGRPTASHVGETSDDYATGWTVCPSMQALDADQAEQRERDEPLRKQGLDPERSRLWVAWRRDEPSPI